MNSLKRKESASPSPSKRHSRKSSNNVPKIFDPYAYYKPNSGVSKEEIVEIKRAFDLFDDDNDGSITPKDLADAYNEMGMNANNKVIYQILAELDHDNSGMIDFDEFIQLATARPDFKPTRNELMKIFRIFDIGSKGKISKQDLKKIADELGQETSDDELKKMMRKADRNDDGFVDFDDFCLITCGKTFDA